MTSNFLHANTASGKPERNAPGVTRLQRRQVLKGALGGVATLGLGSLGLSACGGSDAAIIVTATGLEFIGMPAAMSDVQRATAFTSASVKISYSDATTTTRALTYNTLFKTGDTLKNGSVSHGVGTRNHETNDPHRRHPAVVSPMYLNPKTPRCASFSHRAKYPPSANST